MKQNVEKADGGAGSSIPLVTYAQGILLAEFSEPRTDTRTVERAVVTATVAWCWKRNNAMGGRDSIAKALRRSGAKLAASLGARRWELTGKPERKAIFNLKRK